MFSAGVWTAPYAGPMLNAVVPISVGPTVVRDQFVFACLCGFDLQANVFHC
jgi:hypothetical protein